MKITIIYSNHHSGNYIFHLLEKLKSSLTEASHELVVRDLYQMKFNPVLTIEDFEKIAEGKTPQDIAKEQGFVKWADLLIFIYPIWWGGMPAILKGYIDRIFTSGFAYRSYESGILPLLSGKKALIMSTMGQAKADYEKGMFKAMNLVNVEGIFGFCGIDVEDHLYISSIHKATEQEKEHFFDQAVEAVRKVAEAFTGVKM
jgi:NAD(P)H dehydrogenase (quinone)